jgi:hypothetical protein
LPKGKSKVLLRDQLNWIEYFPPKEEEKETVMFTAASALSIMPIRGILP